MRAAGFFPTALVVFAVAIAGCTAGPFADRTATASRLAAARGWSERIVDAPRFSLLTYSAPDPKGDVLTVYIEGDGLAWRSRFEPSRDPTPPDPVALRLALADPAPGVAWIARPCQYRMSPACGVEAWTNARFSTDAVAATDAAVERLKAAAGARRIVLAGYSGGGVIAALVAARRDDVAGLITIAAPLDVAAWVRHHDVDPLAGSLDPAQCCASRLGAIPQRHVAGARDDVVPATVVQSYIRALGAPEVMIVSVDAAHRCCFPEIWPALAPRLRAAVLSGGVP